METAIRDFIAASERCLQLERARIQARTPEELELVSLELLDALLDVQHHAQIITGIRFAENIDFVRVN